MIFNELAGCSAVGSVPLNQLSTLRIYNQFAAETEQTEHRKPTAEEFADYADITLEKAKMLIALNNKAVSADSPIGGDYVKLSTGRQTLARLLSWYYLCTYIF